MSLTDIQQQSLIIAQLGDYDGILAQNMAIVWEQHASRTTQLRTLYVKRDCIDLLLASVRELVDFTGPNGVTLRSSQKADILNQMRKDCLADIERQERRIVRGTAGASGMIKTVAPVTADSPPDSNNPRYRGTPYK